MTVDNDAGDGVASVRVVDADDLDPDDRRPDPNRETVFETDRVLLTRTSLASASRSDWHRHPRRGAYAYVRSGRLRLEYGAAGDRRVEAGPGEFAYTPAGGGSRRPPAGRGRGRPDRDRTAREPHAEDPVPPMPRSGRSAGTPTDGSPRSFTTTATTTCSAT